MHASEATSTRRWLAPAALATLAAMAGCAPGRLARQPRGISRTAPELAPIAGTTVEGRDLTARVHGVGGRTLLLLGAIHGDEPGSRDLVRDFEAWLANHAEPDDRLTVVVCSEVNPDGLARGTRANAKGVDLNRNFPAHNFTANPRHGKAPLSESEARFVAELMYFYRPVLVISVHQPRHSVNWDGPARSIAAAMSERNAYRLEPSIGYPTPGSLGSWVGVDNGTPIITLELPERPAAASFLDDNLQALRAALAMAATLPETWAFGSSRPGVFAAPGRSAPAGQSPAPSR